MYWCTEFLNDSSNSPSRWIVCLHTVKVYFSLNHWILLIFKGKTMQSSNAVDCCLNFQGRSLVLDLSYKTDCQLHWSLPEWLQWASGSKGLTDTMAYFRPVLKLLWVLLGSMSLQGCRSWWGQWLWHHLSMLLSSPWLRLHASQHRQLWLWLHFVAPTQHLRKRTWGACAREVVYGLWTIKLEAAKWQMSMDSQEI